MFNILFSLALILGLATALPPAGEPSCADNNHGSELAEREEINRTCELSPGARVEVSGINGSVDIETTTGTTAEIQVVRSAKSKADLAYHKILIETSSTSLVVRGENDNERGHRSRAEVRHRVVLKIPRQVDLSTSGVNGRVRVGEIDGPIQISGINGALTVGKAVGYSKISGINGSVTFTIERLADQGIRISGINGRVEIGLLDDVNADVTVDGINGSVHMDGIMNVTVQGKIEPSSFRGKIGSGGIPIKITGINGSVRFSPNR